VGVVVDFSKGGFIKSSSFSKDLSAYKIVWSHVEWCKFCIKLSGLKIPQLPYLKGPLQKIIIQIKLVGISTMFHCTKFISSKCKGSRAVAIKQNVNFKHQPPTMFVFFFCLSQK
jgi:hypothetical protein